MYILYTTEQRHANAGRSRTIKAPSDGPKSNYIPYKSVALAWDLR